MPLSGERFEELYQEHWPLVFALCRSRLGNHDEALDAAGEVFVRKWRARHTYDPARASFRTWVSRNAEHLCIDYLRRRAVRPDPEELPDDLPAPEAGGGESARSLDRVAVGKALARLTPRQRQLVLMHEVEGYTWEEIAAIAGLTVAQARGGVSKGLELLRSFLLGAGV